MFYNVNVCRCTSITKATAYSLPLSEIRSYKTLLIQIAEVRDKAERLSSVAYKPDCSVHQPY